MSRYRTPFVLWGIAIAGLVLSLVASVADWPAQLGTDGSSPEGTLQWMVSGTAVSSPLGFLVVTAIVGVLATRDSVIGTIADALALVIAVFTIIGSLGEAFAPDPVTAPRVVLVASGVLGLVFAALIAWSVFRDLRLRRSLKRS